MDTFRYVGSTPAHLDGGRPIAPGEFTGEIDAALPENKLLIDEGKLLQVPTDHKEKEEEARAIEAREEQTFHEHELVDTHEETTS